METTLKDLIPGDIAEITGYHKNEADNIYKKKLLSMGLTKGVIFTVIKKAPLGDPIEINLRGFNLSLRKKEAEILEIKKLEN